MLTHDISEFKIVAYHGIDQQQFPVNNFFLWLFLFLAQTDEPFDLFYQLLMDSELVDHDLDFFIHLLVLEEGLYISVPFAHRQRQQLIHRYILYASWNQGKIVLDADFLKVSL